LAGDAHGSSAELVGHGGSCEGLFHGNVAVAEGLDERCGHGSIFWGLRNLHKVYQFCATPVSDPLARGGLIFEMLGHEDETFRQASNKLLGEDPDKLRGEQGRGVFSFGWAEDAVEAFDGLGGAPAMDGGEDEVAGFGGLEGGASGDGIPDLT